MEAVTCFSYLVMSSKIGGAVGGWGRMVLNSSQENKQLDRMRGYQVWLGEGRAVMAENSHRWAFSWLHTPRFEHYREGWTSSEEAWARVLMTSSKEKGLAPAPVPVPLAIPHPLPVQAFCLRWRAGHPLDWKHLSYPRRPGRAVTCSLSSDAG